MRILAAIRGWIGNTALAALLLWAAPVWASAGLVFAVAKVPLSLPVYVAEAEGYFKAEKLDLKIVDCEIGRQCLERLLDGKAQLATTAASPIVFASLRGAKFSILATIANTQTFNRIVTRRSLGIATVADLRNKRVGTFQGTSAHYFLELSLLAAGVDPSSVTIVPIQPGGAPQSLASGETDAVAVFEPFTFDVIDALGSQALVLPSRRLVTDTWSIVVAKSLDGQREADLQRLCRALDRAIQFAADNPERARTIFQARLGLDRAAFDRTWRDINFDIELRQSLITGLEGQARWAIRQGHVTGTVPNFLDYVRPDPLARVRAGAVSVVR
ncbi:MAG TPA: ABC transporter substrate-binding protein [Ideonella sp.]|uniref:ABC transporter substrate-binding protein n=1 Tax=Ideonella sp. TaxID=1929293 RepID=UPI002E361DBE|nr:ABC transporter substrate-binding protein [Ideonella sp.]HEX5685298.1 ABC transporter substrate-binding protein [Ideonella sp.]